MDKNVLIKSSEYHDIFIVEIKLEEGEVKFLRDFVKKGRKNAREVTRARILLRANKQKGDTEIVDMLGVGRNTVWRVKKRYRKGGLQSGPPGLLQFHFFQKLYPFPSK